MDDLISLDRAGEVFCRLVQSLHASRWTERFTAWT